MEKKEENQKLLKTKTIYDLTPDELDRIVLRQLDNWGNRKKNNKNAEKCNSKIKTTWDDDALAIRRMVVLDYMAQGLSHHRISQELRKRWGVCETTSYAYIKDCANYLGEQVAEFAENNYEIALHRAEAVAEDAIARNDNKTALKAFDMINRLQGLYEEKVKVEADNTIEFKFGGE